MTMRIPGRIVLAAAMLAPFAGLGGAELEKAVQDKIDAKVKEIAAWAVDPVVVKAVKEQNESPSADVKAMTQEKWKGLSQLDPFVRALTKNAVGQFLKGKKDDQVAEAFVSSADGTKVGLLGKTTNWCHKGKAKHDDPMAGKTWQGPVEMDESSGIKSVQVAVPVLDGGKPIGSLVVGLNLAKLQ
jgi:hypothetical protein